MATAARSMAGVLRLYAQKAPAKEMAATLTLLLASNGAAGAGGSSGEGYVLPAATATRLGGVKIGDGLSVSEDGTLSVDGDAVIEDIAATDSEVEEALDEIYGAESTD